MTCWRLARRKNVVLFEDDHESELNFSGRPLPALKSLDPEGRVIYLGSLSKTLAHGLRLGFVVAPAELIRELRAMRRLMMRHVPSNNAHIASLFIAQGHHDAFIRKLNCDLSGAPQGLAGCAGQVAARLHREPGARRIGCLGAGPVRPRLRQRWPRLCQARGVLIEAGQVFFAQARDRPTRAAFAWAIRPFRVRPSRPACVRCATRLRDWVCADRARLWSAARTRLAGSLGRPRQDRPCGRHLSPGRPGIKGHCDARLSCSACSAAITSSSLIWWKST